jgi:hypothetical protein
MKAILMKKEFLQNHLDLSKNGSPQEREEATPQMVGTPF